MRSETATTRTRPSERWRWWRGTKGDDGTLKGADRGSRNKIDDGHLPRTWCSKKKGARPHVENRKVLIPAPNRQYVGNEYAGMVCGDAWSVVVNKALCRWMVTVDRSGVTSKVG